MGLLEFIVVILFVSFSIDFIILIIPASFLHLTLTAFSLVVLFDLHL